MLSGRKHLHCNWEYEGVFFFQVRSSNLSGKKITFPKIVRKEKENENVKNK